MKNLLRKKILARYSTLERRDFLGVFLFLLPTLNIFFLFYLSPICTVAATAFTKWNGFTAPAFNGLENFGRLFRHQAFLKSLQNMVLWTLLAASAHVGFGVVLAFIFYLRPVGWKRARAVYMVPMVMSGAAWAMIYRILFSESMGVLNVLIRLFNPDFHVEWFYTSPYAFWAITFTWVFFAVTITLIVHSDLMAIPEEINDAARIDGASGWQITRWVHLPLCRQSLGTGMVLALTSRIGMYEAIALTSRWGPGNDTMSIPILLVRAVTDMQYGYANAIALVMSVIGLGVLWGANRLFKPFETVY
jgi:raffinose/stachyose/melibiose transport system permease protein